MFNTSGTKIKIPFDLRYTHGGLREGPCYRCERIWRPTMSLELALKELSQGGEVEEEEEHLSISQLRARRERVESIESIIPLPWSIQRGKHPKTPASRPQKKRKKTKAFAEGRQRRLGSWPLLFLLPG